MKVYLLGAANPESIRMIRAVQRAVPCLEFCAFLDNDPAKKGRDFFGVPIVGGLELLPTLVGDGVAFINLITGNTRTRCETTRQIVAAGGCLTNFIHPSIDMTMVRVGLGNYFQEGVQIQAQVTIGDNSSIHMGALIGHETVIGDSVFVAHAVSISGCCRIGDGTFIGTNATVLPRISIGKWATIGAGAVVTKDVPDFGVAVGNPARVIKFNDIPHINGSVYRP